MDCMRTRVDNLSTKDDDGADSPDQLVCTFARGWQGSRGWKGQGLKK
jgi:hypothetical protein